MSLRRLILRGAVVLTALRGAPAEGQSPPTPGQIGVERVDSLRAGETELLPPTRLTVAEPSPVPAGLPAEYRLDDLIRLGLERHPRLAQAGFAIDAARGRALQAGLYPNPTIAAVFDELGDVQSRAGVNTIPLITQEIVTGGKLGLSRAAAEREVDQATLALAVRRAELLVAGLLAELRDPAQVFTRLHDDQTLSAPLRRAAMQALIRQGEQARP